MSLSRLNNLLRNPSGSVIYVDPGNFDATDSFDNRGDSATRPFSTIQRALIEASRFSYQSGVGNDLNDRTTILVSSGVHYIDNRPGFSITKNNSGDAIFKKRTGKNDWDEDILNQFDSTSNFNIFDTNNDLYKFNSVEGGVILPRGTSIVGLDLRKTKIRPLYVPDPNNTDVDRSSIFKITGNCYFTSFTFFDADPAVAVYKDYSYELVNPKYSHNKLTAFTYADGVNLVKLGFEQTDLTDLQMYYYKIAKAYGNTSERSIPDYPSTIDIEPIVDEYRIVGVLEENLLGISTITAGTGGILNEIQVTTKDLVTNLDKPHNLSVNTPILISGVTVSPTLYNGSFVVKSVVGPNTFTYITSSTPTPITSSSQVSGALIKVESDTTSSSSPYIFNCSLRSVYGMCGLWADGSKADGFKSVVVAQFTGISLQKDDNAFLLYSKATNNYITSSQLAQDSNEKPLHTNSYAIHNPEYENFHIKVSNNGFIQCVSIFAIGFSKHFVTETGGDMSITNSNSNFGALALESYGFRNESFNRDDVGYITHIIPPREATNTQVNVNWLPIDVALTVASGNSTNRNLYLYGYDNIDLPPSSKIDGYRIGAKVGETINLIINDTSYSSPISMQTYDDGVTQVSGKKTYQVSRSGSINSISSDIITLTTSHQLISGEKVRVFSDTGQVPDGLASDTIYYVIRINSTQIKLSYNYNDAVATIPVNISEISSNGGILTIVSSVSDKVPGEVGHPIQWDTSVNNWYVISSKTATNQIYSQVSTLGTSTLGSFTDLSSFSRRAETRSIEDRLYKVRYVIPKEYTEVRAPGIGFVFQESKTVGVTVASIDSGSTLKVTDRRNEKVISSISAGSISNNSQTVTTKTEAPHKLLVGDVVKIQNVASTYNPSALGITSTFNGSFNVLTVPDSHTFTYKIVGVSTNPGAFTNSPGNRTSSSLLTLPVVSKQEYKDSFTVYRVETIKNHVPGTNGQDGIYHITMISANVKLSDTVGYGLSFKKFNQDVRNLYPQVDRDNYISDPQAATSCADDRVIGKVVTNDKKKSVTKEALEYFIQDNSIGFGITSLSLSGVGNTAITIKANIEHKLNSIKQIGTIIKGSESNQNYYGARVTVGSTITDAVCNYVVSAGAVTSVEFVDFGSAFTQGQTIGIGTQGTTAVITQINSNISDGLELSGFLQNELNGVFKITSVPDSTTVVIQHPTGISSYISNTNSRIPFGFISSKGVGITSFRFADINTGIVTVTTSEPHGLLEGNNFTVIGSGSPIYDSNFIVRTVVGLSTFTFNIGIATTNPSSTTGTILRRTLTTNAKTTGKSGENLGSRSNYIYAGISTTISALVPTASQITFTDASGFNKGDYIQVNNEIIRLVDIASSNTFQIQRAMFGTLRTSAISGTLIQKIKVLPMELRRPSFLRASGHTFEYLGYGPGNYSTSVPQKQTRKLSEDEILVSQSRKVSGGTVVYSGMNDLGEFYYGAKRVSSVTGQETIIEAPIISFTADDVDGTDDPSKLSGIFDKLLVRQGITVEGGDSGNETSIFYGPVRFNNGISLQGNFSADSLSIKNKKFTVDDKTGIVNLGAISYTGVSSSYIGEIYLNSGWRRWGLISKSENIWDLDLGASSSIKVTNLIVDNNLTINGVNFSGNLIDSLTLNKLKVTGISTFEGGVYGLNGSLSILDNINVGSGSNAIKLNQDGRTIDVGLSSNVGFSTINLHNDDSIFPQYGLRITRNSGSGSVKSQILHRGTQPLEIGTEDVGSSIILTNSGNVISGISTLSLTLADRIVTVGLNENTGGSGGAHLAILNSNTGTNSDAVISWRSNTKRYWFSGVKASDNSWNVALAGPSVGIRNQTFNTDSTVLSILESGNAVFKGDVKSKSININTTIAGEGDLASNGGFDGTFGIYNSTPNGSISLNLKDGSNITQERLRLDSAGTLVTGDTTVDGSLTVTGNLTGSLKLATIQSGAGTNAITFTVPSYAKKIHIVMSNVQATGGNGAINVRLGTAGGILSSGYNSSSATDGGSTDLATDSFIVANNVDGGTSWSGIVILATAGNNIWASLGTLYPQRTSSGVVTLPGALTTVQILRSNSSRTLTGGNVNILYEG